MERVAVEAAMYAPAISLAISLAINPGEIILLPISQAETIQETDNPEVSLTGQIILVKEDLAAITTMAARVRQMEQIRQEP